MPFVIAIAIPYITGEQLASSSDFRVALEMYRDQPATRRLDPEGAIQAMIFQQFLILLVLTPVAGAMSVAAYAVVGEKAGAHARAASGDADHDVRAARGQSPRRALSQASRSS